MSVNEEIERLANGRPVISFHQFSNVIDGQLVGTAEKRRTTNPSTLQLNPEGPLSTQADVEKAIEAAERAAYTWAKVPVAERQVALARFADALEATRGDFATMLVREQGKPFSQAQEEIGDALRMLRGIAKLSLQNEVLEDTDDRRVVLKYVPIATFKLGPAVIAGSPIILKPSPFTPYCGLKLAELSQAFFPPGVVQALAGDDNLGTWLTIHPRVKKVSFTGSVQTGKMVMESCSKTLTPVTLELTVLTQSARGGNDPAIVYPDVNIATTAPKIAVMALYNAGQVCIAAKRVYVHSSIFKEFVSAMVDYIKSMVVADGFDASAFIGPIQNEMQFNKIKQLLKTIHEDQLKIAVGNPTTAVTGEGYFIKPLVVENPPDDSRIVVDEPFGPIFPVMQWTDEEDLVRRANDSDLGLGASIWTNNIRQAERLSNKLQAGTVWINHHMETRPNAPFGGHKLSGLGCELGIDGLKSYCNVQVMNINRKF